MESFFSQFFVLGLGNGSRDLHWESARLSRVARALIADGARFGPRWEGSRWCLLVNPKTDLRLWPVLWSELRSFCVIWRLALCCHSCIRILALRNFQSYGRAKGRCLDRALRTTLARGERRVGVRSFRLLTSGRLRLRRLYRVLRANWQRRNIMKHPIIMQFVIFTLVFVGLFRFFLC